MAGTRSFAASRSSGVDWCYTINTAEMYNSTAALDQLTSDLNAAIDASGI
jgi:hypothetical protein